MEDPLVTYLHDHLAGANFAVELLENLESVHSGHETGAFAAAMLSYVEADREVLKALIGRVGAGHFDAKDALAWLSEKASRIKLSRGEPDGLGVFESIEMLGLGIMGKLALWRALSAVAAFDARLAEIDLPNLMRRAQDQYKSVEEYALSLTQVAFRKAA